MQKLFENRSEALPERDVGEKLWNTIQEGILAAIPGIGPFANEFFKSFVRVGFENRRAQWLRELAEDIDGIGRRLTRVEAHRTVAREDFVTAVLRASNIAVNSHREEKRRCLRNALLNIALARAPGEDEREVLFNAIEAFSPAHMKVLAVLRHPLGEIDRAIALRGQWQRGGIHGGRLREAILFICPELSGNGDLVDAILRDLTARGFARVSGGDEVFPQATWITNFGIAMLEFVSAPPEDVPRAVDRVDPEEA